MTAPADSRISDDRLDEMLANLVSTAKMIGDLKTGGVLSEEIALITELRERRAQAVTVKPRDKFPVLNSGGATVDLQLVLDHGEQAKSNHGQTVTRLAERGGLSWCELYAVLHNKRWKAMDDNEAMIACRALEARYLAAIAAPPPAQAAGVTEAQNGNRPLPFDRDTLGRFVREAWVRWAETQPSPKPNWLVPYDDLSEPDKEADRQIGEAVARWTIIGEAASLSAQDREE